jgi:hypothetical protein
MALVYYLDARMPFAANATVWLATCLWAVLAGKALTTRPVVPA